MTPRPRIDYSKGRVERRWWCDYCDTFYAEYVNGCPRCYMGEVGTSTSVKLVWATKTETGWRKATDEEIPDEPS